MMLLFLLAGAAMARVTEYETKWAPLTDKKKWELYKDEQSLDFPTIAEELKTFKVFKTNLRRIEEHNAKDLPYWFGITKFAHMTPEEFKNATFCNIKYRETAMNVTTKRESKDAFGPDELRSDIDWVAQGKVTPVKNQGQCGSCWAFSTTGALETAYAIKHGGSPPSLSEQELVDCAGSPNAGCNGGSMYYAFQFAEQGLCSENDYPYKAQTLTYECSSMKSNCQAQVYATGAEMVVSRSMTALMTAVNQGAVSVAIEADQSSFQLYRGGVFTGDCGTRLDHGVLVVGYGSDSAAGGDFWKVKNSWGPGWGEGGYIRLCRNCGKNRWSGQCGILEQPVYPDVQ